MTVYIMANNWSTEFPIHPGVYLARFSRMDEPVFVQIFADGRNELLGLDFGEESACELRDKGYTEWCGPLIPLTGGWT